MAWINWTTVIVPDIAEDAFQDAVKSNPPFEAVVHTASPFHFNVANVQRDLLDPAVMGTTGTRSSLRLSSAWLLRRRSRPLTTTLKELGWSTRTPKPIGTHHARASSSRPDLFVTWQARRSLRRGLGILWRKKPNFDPRNDEPTAGIWPHCPLPILNSLSALNTSNERLRDFVQDVDIPESRVYL